MSALSASKAQILLADDDDLVRMVTSMALEDAGFEVAEAPSAAALRDALTAQPALVVLDINIPGIEISESLELIKGSADRPPQVLVLSGDASRADAIRALGHDFLAKPVDVDDLLLHVERLVAEHQG